MTDKNILWKVRQLNLLLQEAQRGIFSFDEICKMVGDLTDSNVYLANTNGKILGCNVRFGEQNGIALEEKDGTLFVPCSYNDAVLSVKETKANFIADENQNIIRYQEGVPQDRYHTLIPVSGGGNRWGSMLVVRCGEEYADEELALVEMAATVMGLIIQRIKLAEAYENDRKEAMVNMALGSLSYSESEAVKLVFSYLDGNEGVFVASKIADKSSITRSVIVNALRKLESAGVIQSRSLGMKGTHIKIANDKFLHMLDM